MLKKYLIQFFTLFDIINVQCKQNVFYIIIYILYLDVGSRAGIRKCGAHCCKTCSVLLCLQCT